MTTFVETVIRVVYPVIIFDTLDEPIALAIDAGCDSFEYFEIFW